MKKAFIIILLILSGCAHDNYAVIPDSEGSPEKMSHDLYKCKIEAIHKYQDSQPPVSTGQVAGAAAAGVLGGFIGGAIFGAGMSASGSTPADNGAIKRKDIHLDTEKCMRDKGYLGTSN
jgi:hypothetical protein